MDPSQYVTTAEDLQVAKMYSLASCVMLYYDMSLTFGDEVEKIWKQKFTAATFLWFMNRYLTPLGYIVITVSFHDPDWGIAACNRYVLFPEILKVFTASAVGAIFVLRLYAVYARSRYILVGFTTLLSLELAIKIWSFTDGARLPLPPGLVGCVLTGKSSSNRIMFTWVAELIFDTCVFFAMLYKTLDLYRRMARSPSVMHSIVHVLLRDGVVYFAVIFVANLVTVIIYVTATPSLKVINASFSTMITTLMVSRLMLNLRRPNDPTVPDSLRTTGAPAAADHRLRAQATSDDRTISTDFVGNLGQPVETLRDEENIHEAYEMHDHKGEP